MQPFAKLVKPFVLGAGAHRAPAPGVAEISRNAPKNAAESTAPAAVLKGRAT